MAFVPFRSARRCGAGRCRHCRTRRPAGRTAPCVRRTAREPWLSPRCCSTMYGGSAVASERERPTLSMQAFRSALSLRRDRMSRRVLQAPLIAALCAACQSEGAAQRGAGAGDRPFTVTEVADFSTPWAMAFPARKRRSADRHGAADRKGRQAVAGRRRPPASATAGSGVPEVAVAGQGGLGDVVPHPDFAGNQRIYLSFVEAGRAAPAARRSAMARSILGNAAAPALDGFQGHLAAAAQGRRRRPFLPPHRFWRPTDSSI